MSFKEKNIVVTLVNFTLIEAFFLVRVLQMLQNEGFNSTNVFRLWGIVIFFAIVVSIVASILTHIVPVIIQAIKTGEEGEEIDDLEDERDKLIDSRGTKLTYSISSFGTSIAMLTFVLGQPPLVMFSLLIFFGVLAQIIGDILRLLLYRGEF
jgi:hypothetical protein